MALNKDIESIIRGSRQILDTQFVLKWSKVNFLTVHILVGDIAIELVTFTVLLVAARVEP